MPCLVSFGCSTFRVNRVHCLHDVLSAVTVHFRPLLPAFCIPILLCSWFANIDFPEQLYPLISPLYQLALCRQFYLILILNVITHQATVARVLHTTCYYLLGQHKTYFTDAHESLCPCKPI